MWDFPKSPAVNSVTRSIYEAGGVVAAVCHGPAALVNVTLSNGTHLVAGKNVAAFTDDEERAVELDKEVPFLLATTLVARGAHQTCYGRKQRDGFRVSYSNFHSMDEYGQIV
jgi:putative intracellular protease/amidase